jgi:hypothetical protein
MERMIGLILIVTAIWVGVEFYTEGDQAFGGIFASESSSSASSGGYDDGAAPAEGTWAGERAGHKLERMHAERAQRMKERLNDGSDPAEE